MLKVYDAHDVVEAERIKSLLEQKGITAFVFGEHTFNLFGVNPLAFPSIWIDDDEQFNAAKRHISAYEKQAKQNQGDESGEILTPWRCPKCHEINEASFDYCWFCGESQPE